MSFIFFIFRHLISVLGFAFFWFYASFEYLVARCGRILYHLHVPLSLPYWKIIHDDEEKSSVLLLLL